MVTATIDEAIRKKELRNKQSLISNTGSNVILMTRCALLIPLICLIISCSKQSEKPANSGQTDSTLVGYFPFSGNADDASGNKNNGTVRGGKGSVVLVPDRFDNPKHAYWFNGRDGFVEITFTSMFNFSQPITITAWIKPDSLHVGGIVGQWGYGGAGFDAYMLNINEGSLQVNFAMPGIYSIISKSNIADNQWTFVSMTYDGNNVSLFINGDLDSTGIFLCPNVVSDQTVKIGLEDIAYGGQHYFNGTIDDVRIYKRVLINSEINTLYHEGGW
jgi:hypothetical protein